MPLMMLTTYDACEPNLILPRMLKPPKGLPVGCSAFDVECSMFVQYFYAMSQTLEQRTMKPYASA